MLRITTATFIFSFIVQLSHAEVPAGAQAIPRIQFENAQSIPVNQLCLDNKHVRPRLRSPMNLGVQPRPVREVIEYELGHQRKFTLIRKVQVKDHLIRRYARRNGVQQLVSQGLYDIQECESSLIMHKPEVITEARPSAQQMLAFSALFQKGITLAQTGGYPFQLMYHSSHFNYGFRQTDQQESPTSSTLKTPQCQDGKFELSPEFMRYLKGPEGHRVYRDVVDLMDTDPDYAENYFNQIWNNHLNGKDLRFKGGEGSGNGKVGFGLSFIGGEGSGNGRRLEQTTTDPLSVNPEGEVKVKVYMPTSEYLSLAYGPGLIQRLFGQEVKYKEYLVDGELIPENIVGVECK